MERKRDGFAPIGDIAFDVPGDPAKALSDRAPQAMHHFTRFDQIDQLVDASEADVDLGFMARLLVLCSLPRTDPKNRHEFKRVNGPYKLVMVAGAENKLPFGNLPRLLLAWVCTEAVRTQHRELVLGRSLYEFMHKLGMADRSGSARGDRTRLKNQLRRLFGCTVTLVYEDEQRASQETALPAVRPMGLIRFRGHRPKGGYDGQNGIKAGRETSATTVL